MAEAKQVIDNVEFYLKKAQGKCSICPDTGEMMQITAVVEYYNPETKQMVKEAFQAHYCKWCFSEAMGLINNPESLQGYA